MDPKTVADTVLGLVTSIGLKIVGAILLWFVGRWLIGLSTNLISKAFSKKIDATLLSYIISTIGAVLNVILVISILGAFGVETTTFAVLFAAVGLAIGTAWGGLLANFAAGVFLVLLRPFKVGEFVCAGGVTGTVIEIGPFVTKINTPDNILTTVGNNKIFSDNIQNFSANAYRRVEITKQFSYDVDVKDVVQNLKAKLPQIANVLATPAPDVEILEHNPAGIVLAVRPYCSNADYWQVYFDTNKLIQEVSEAGGYPLVPTQRMVVLSPDGKSTGAPYGK
ncbi:MAG: mechanosensitive ion channel family protein [Gloeobacterales cyanobacterium]